MEKKISRITMRRIDDHLNFEATGRNGKTILMDGAPAIGGKGNGVGPMETLLMGLAGCSGMDIVMILKKMKQTITDFRVEVEAVRVPEDDASFYETIHLHFIVSGDVREANLEKAIRLSIDKYCSVSKILKKSATITTAFTIENSTF